MPSVQKLFSASVAFTLAVLAAEIVIGANNRTDFVLFELTDPTLSQECMLANSVAFILYSLPRPIAYSSKILFPLIAFYFLINYDDEELDVPDQYSPHLVSYLEKQKKLMPLMAEYVQLGLDDEDPPEALQDSIFNNLMATPVTLYSHKYNLKTLLSLTPKTDPFTRTPFVLRDIQADWDTAEKVFTHLQHKIGSAKYHAAVRR
jgi:hypothetical protein